MRFFGKPMQSEIESFLAEQRRYELTYAQRSGSKTPVLKGFDRDCNRVLLGRGEATYLLACNALKRWAMFPQHWTEIRPTRASQELGTTVAVLVYYFGVWWLNASRIVYVVDQLGPPCRLGFAYGTLPGHAECGEEQFLVEWDDEDRVWYEISSISRPRFWLARIAYPLSRRLQRRFVRDSLNQMKLAVAEDLSG